EASSASNSRPIRILIADDHAAVRESLRQTLEERSEFQIVGEASNGFEAIDQARSCRPDAIVMDISMPKMDGVEATRRIHAEFPSIQIVGLSSAERTGSIHPIEEAGARGYFVKGPDLHRLIERLLSISMVRSAFRERAT